MEGFDWKVPKEHVHFHKINAYTCEYLGQGFYITPAGVTVKMLENGIVVEMTGCGSIRLTDTMRGMSVVLGKSKFVVGFTHPTGRFFRSVNKRIEIMTFDPRGNYGLDRFVHLSPNAVSFKERYNHISLQIMMRHTVRLAGNDFYNLEFDFLTPLLYHDCDIGFDYYLDDSNILTRHQYWVKNGDKFWRIRNILILQHLDGKVRVSRNNFRDNIRMDPVLGRSSLTTPYIHATASTGIQSHFFLRSGNQRVFYDGSTLWCRMGRNSLGIDRFNNLVRQPEDTL